MHTWSTGCYKNYFTSKYIKKIVDDNWDPEVWDDDWELEEQEAPQGYVRTYLRNIITVIVLLAILSLYGVYQSTLFRRTPDQMVEEMTPLAAFSEIRIPLTVIVFRSNGSRDSARSEENVQQLVANASALWQQAAITLYVEKTEFIQATDEEIGSFIEYPASFFERFSNEADTGITVFLFETLSGVNGIAFNSARTIAVADFTTDGDYRTLAHEVGHILGLSHSQDRNDLMYSGSRGSTLSREEVERARSTAEAFHGTL